LTIDKGRLAQAGVHVPSEAPRSTRAASATDPEIVRLLNERFDRIEERIGKLEDRLAAGQ